MSNSREIIHLIINRKARYKRHPICYARNHKEAHWNIFKYTIISDHKFVISSNFK